MKFTIIVYKGHSSVLYSHKRAQKNPPAVTQICTTNIPSTKCRFPIHLWLLPDCEQQPFQPSDYPSAFLDPIRSFTPTKYLPSATYQSQSQYMPLFFSQLLRLSSPSRASNVA
ncbi:unnamed protein product, partial [Heterosigma akashiwo]